MTLAPRFRLIALSATALLLAAATAVAQNPDTAKNQPPAPDMDQPGMPPVVALQCSGNEPFWRLDLGPGTALLRRPAAEEVEATTFTGTLDSLDYLDPPWHVWRGEAASGEGVTDAPTGGIVAMVREEACRDTMKGDIRDARAVVALPGGGNVSGCCTLRGPLAEPARAGDDGPPFADFGGKPVTDWARVLPDLLTAVQACVEDSAAPVREVVKAWPMNRGMVGARMKTSDGALHDCTATTGGKVESLARLPEDAEPLPGQGEPTFLPARAKAPEVSCGDLERVSGPQGEAVAGYLLYDEGCGATGGGTD